MFIRLVKNLRRRSALSTIHKEGDYFAFIGVGSHSMENLFPCIHYLGVPLKYIYSSDPAVARMAARRFPNCSAVSSIVDILSDNTIKGVFICTKAAKHFGYALAALQAGKYVFVEKPPCFTGEELKLLELAGNKRCMVGFQKRYCVINSYLKKFKAPASYNYRYLTGVYPGGNPVVELFSHAVDNVIFLFGNVDKIGVVARRDNGSIGYILNVMHANGVIGSLEVSTAYSWRSFVDRIVINYNDKTVSAGYPAELQIQKKSGVYFHLPAEKIFSGGTEAVQLLSAGNSTPVLIDNHVYLNGYFGEVQQFVTMVGRMEESSVSCPSALTETWRMIEVLQNYEFNG